MPDHRPADAAAGRNPTRPAPAPEPASSTPGQTPDLSRRALLRHGAHGAWLAGGGALLAACGGGGDAGGAPAPAPAPPPGPGPGGALPAAERVAVLAAVKAEFERLAGGGLHADSAAIAAFLRAQPHLGGVRVMADGCVSARFVDGPGLVVGNNLRPGRPRPTAGGAGGAAAPQAATAVTSARATPAATSAAAAAPAAAADELPQSGVPASDRALSLSSFLNYGDPEDGSIRDIDLARHHLRRSGYTLDDTDGPTVARLKALPELGFLNWFTHGGTLEGGSGEVTHALMTRTPATLENVIAHLPDLQAGNLVFYFGNDRYRGGGQWRGDFFFAITPAFVTRYGWRFSENSVVMIHACLSDTPGWREAFSAAGASLYGGWNQPVWVHMAAGAMGWQLGDLLASNLAAPTPNPRQRTQDHVAVLRSSDAAGWTRYDDPDAGGEVRFRFHVLKHNPGGLAPALGPLTVQEHLGHALLRGRFGRTPGRVFIGTALVTDPGGADNFLPWRPGGTVTELAVVDWRPDEVTVVLPRSGPGSAGHLAVRVGERWSNARAITRWTGSFDALGRGPGSLRLEHRLQFSWRADIGLWREAADAPLQALPAPFNATPHEAPLLALWDWVAGGEHSAAGPGPSTLAVQWAGQGRVPLQAAPAGPQALTLTGLIDRGARQVRLLITGGQLDAVEVTQSLTIAGSTSTQTGRQNLALPAGLAPVSEAGFGFVLALDDDLAIAAGERQFTETTPLPVAEPGPGRLDWTLRWGAMTPEFVPDGRGGV